MWFMDGSLVSATAAKLEKNKNDLRQNGAFQL